MNPKLIPAATQDQMNYITRINADQQLHIIISFKAHIQEQLLSSAMLLTILRDPVLGCRFIEKNNRTYWQPRQDLTASDLCSLVFTADLQKDLFEFVTMPSDPLIDPLFRARIFRGAANDTLCVKVNHVLADGAGTKEVVYLISDTYSKLAVEPGYTPEKSKFYPRSQAVIFKKVGLANLIKFRPRTFTLPKPLFELPFVHETGAGSAFALRQIKPEIFKAIKEYGKLNQATLNDLILTAYYRSLCLNGNPPLNTPLPVQVSIDLRHFLPAGHTQRICNLSGGLFPAITFTPGETFQETLKKVQEKMAHWKSRQPGLTGAIIMELAMLQGFKNHSAHAAGRGKTG
ncbi:MAG: hypothetical protein LWX83_12300 [Anaerolineae bacterium]|nr:hypothetical protein [Anaerolineae bacterium]